MISTRVATIATTVSRSNLTGSRRSMSNGVGFIGLGNMGNSMAKNLLTNPNVGGKGVPVVVFDLNKEVVAKLVAQGAKSANTVKELAQQCSTIITMLPATAHVRGTLTGPDGVFANTGKGSLIIDSSTIDPLASRDLHKEAKSHGLHMIDAPVSGGVTGAAAGTLTFMVGGSEADLEKARVSCRCIGPFSVLTILFNSHICLLWERTSSTAVMLVLVELPSYATTCLLPSL